MTKGVKIQVQVEGKVYIATGESSGIGRASAMMFVKEERKGCCGVSDCKQWGAGMKTIRDSGGEATCVQADVSKALKVEGVYFAVCYFRGLPECEDGGTFDKVFV